MEKYIVIILLTFITIFAILLYSTDNYIYKCEDCFGNIVYCESIVTDRGALTGRTIQGKTIVITSYEKILRNEGDK